jgi:hemerythrin superfamily protein
MARAARRSTNRSRAATTATSAKSAKSASRSRGAAKSASHRRSAAPAARRRNGAARSDAISLLKADHRQVESLFEKFERARGNDRKQALATSICSALRVHAQIEEEIFYPAFYEATREEDLHHEAIIEHDGVKRLVAEIESSGPGDEYFDARVSVLSEMVKHHVQEEESRDGLFAKARSSDMDLAALGERLAERKSQLESEPGLLKTAKQIKDAGKGLVTRVLTEA